MKSSVILLFPTALLLMSCLAILLKYAAIANSQPEPAKMISEQHLSIDEIVSLQTALTTTRYYHGKINGILNAATGRALRKLQKDNGLAVTGYPDEATLSILDHLVIAGKKPPKIDKKKVVH